MPVGQDVIPSDLQGALAGRYDLERLLGQGGTANVYLARDLRHGRAVALKVLRPEVAIVVGTSRFLQEIATVAQLSHPHILPLHDSGEAAGFLYFVMPFVEGESLRDRLEREGQIPLAHALRMAGEVADALAYAHAQGVVHRDIKPENILLLAGHAVLTDFGIARGGDPASRITDVGIRMGTPVYMSPEAYCDDEVDGRADIYGLGVVLYEALVGQTPFGGPTLLAMLTRKSSGAFEPASMARQDLPPAVETVLQRALAPDPEERYATASDLRDALSADLSVLGSNATVRQAVRTVAVLPFTNESADSDASFLSDGITDELIHALSRVAGLRVVGRTSVFALRDTGLDAPSIGRRLSADVLLDGSVRLHGGRLRVRVELVNAADGIGLWSERWDREMGDVFAIEDEIAETVSRRLATNVTPHRTSVPGRTVDPWAYEQYLRGRHLWNERTDTALRRSITCFDAAFQADPSLSLATAGRATSLATLALYGLVAPQPTVEEALSTAQRALGDVASRSEALAVRGCLRALHQRRWRLAEADFVAAIAANPNDPVPPHWYAANLLLPLRRFKEAEAQLERARAIDPLSPAINATLGVRFLMGGEEKKGLRQLQDLLSFASVFPMVHYFLGLAWLANEDPDRAVVALETAMSLTGGAPETVSALLAAHAAAGHRSEGVDLMARLETMASERYVSPTLLAQGHAALGHADEAFDQLGRAVHEGALDVVWVGARPTFRPLQSDPRFNGVLEQLGMAPL